LWRVLSRALAKSKFERWQTMTEFGEALALWLYEHGVKEDVCGNSVRALWLDGGLSGVRSEVDTETPRKIRTTNSSSRPPSLIPTVITDPTVFTRMHARARHYTRVFARRGKSLVLGGVGVLAGVAITLSLVEQPRAASTPDVPSASPPLPSASVALPMPTASAPVAPPTAPVSAEPQERDARRTLPTSPRTSTVTAVPTTKAKRVAEAAPPPRVRPQAKAIRDFGF
jgi:hypothetical protein